MNYRNAEKVQWIIDEKGRRFTSIMLDYVCLRTMDVIVNQ